MLTLQCLLNISVMWRRKAEETAQQGQSDQYIFVNVKTHLKMWNLRVFPLKSTRYASYFPIRGCLGDSDLSSNLRRSTFGIINPYYLSWKKPNPTRLSLDLCNETVAQGLISAKSISKTKYLHSINITTNKEPPTYNTIPPRIQMISDCSENKTIRIIVFVAARFIERESWILQHPFEVLLKPMQMQLCTHTDRNWNQKQEW